MSILAGIPPLLNGINAIFGKGIQLQTLGNTITNIFGGDSKVAWGIYLNGKVVLEVDGFIDFELQNSSQIANYRIEAGQFASYNKVDSPFSINIAMVKNGDTNELDKFLSDLDRISNDIELYDIVTPQHVYNSANMLQYSYKRNAQEGYNTLYVFCTFMQILSTAEVALTKSTQTQAGQPIQSTGIQTAK